MTRSNKKWTRVYISGRDMSGYITDVGALGYELDTTPAAALNDECKNVLPGQVTIAADAFNGFLDNTATSGLHAVMNSGTGTYIYTVAYGVLAVPAAGDHCFSWPMEQGTYKVSSGDGFNVVNVSWGGPTSTNTLVSSGFASPWGRVLCPRTTVAAANTATGIDDYGGTSTAYGGILVYHLFSSDNAVTITAQHAATNLDGSFANITGATSGSVNATSAPQSGMVATATTTTINRYLRYQISMGSATTATLFVAFIRRLWI